MSRLLESRRASLARVTKAQFVMNCTLTCVAVAGLLAACTAPEVKTLESQVPNALVPASARVLQSGIDTQFIDDSVRASDNFYQHANGGWLLTTQIPPDSAVWGSYATLRDRVSDQLRGLIEDQAMNVGANPNERRIRDLYASVMDEANIEDLGAKPLAKDLAKIDGMSDKRQIPALIAYLNRIGAKSPYVAYVSQDAKDPTQYAVVLHQSGLGLPDRDFYLKTDAKFENTREKYQTHIYRMLALIGDKKAKSDAMSILGLETALAHAQWSRVETYDPVRTYNKMAIGSLDVLIHGYDWTAFLLETGFYNKTDALIVREPSYFQTFGRILEETPLPVWKAYFKWALLNTAAPYLSKAFVDAHFEFYGSFLRGLLQNLPRWKIAVALVDNAIGDDLGQLYVARYFPPSSKARLEALVANLLSAYRNRINALGWMSAETKRHALDKLAKITAKIGYPKQWRDYSMLLVKPDDPWGNVKRASDFDFQRDLTKLGSQVDRQEWGVTPQTVTAYYDPLMNEIVFPAAYLQPTQFQPDADDAANYGAIGATIGHEISHGFDDRGSKYDADGKLRNWWIQQDREKYTALTAALVAEYDAFEPLPGFHVNGRLTLSENIADNSGLAIAYLAYQASLAGRPAPVIDGLTGDQRFFLSFAQSWRVKTRPAQALIDLKSDPHAPAEFRVLGTLMNQPAFCLAFGVKPGDRMYVAPEKRIAIW